MITGRLGAAQLEPCKDCGLSEVQLAGLGAPARGRVPGPFGHWQPDSEGSDAQAALQAPPPLVTVAATAGLQRPWPA